MKKRLLLMTALMSTMVAWAEDYNVGTDAELRAAIQNDDANITITNDIDLINSTLSIPEGTTVTIDLGGHTLDRKLTKRGEGGGQVITVRSGATLNLSNGTLKGGWGGAGGALVNEGGTVFLTDVIITDNVADDRGGGICNRNGGVLTMTNCTITDNHSNDHSGAKGGGGFFNEENATATLTNVSITGNEAKVCGGGGICNFGTLTLDGCTIQNNAAITNGGGIWQEGTLNVQGANIVTGNKSADRSGGVNSDLFLKTNALITVTGSLAGSTIGIDMESESGIFTSGYHAHNSGVDPATIFLPMVSGVMAISLDGNEAKLASSLAEGEYYYIDHWWDPDNKKIVYLTKILHPGEYTLITPGYYEDTDLNMSGTYVVVTNDKGYKCHYDGIAYASANTKIILCDGAKLEIEGNLEVTKPEVYLDIYGQARNNGVLQNNANITHTGYGLPGIGSNMDTHSFLAFHGGVIIAHGETSRAGISGGVDDLHSEVKFFDAVVEARGGDNGPGIGLWDAANKYYETLSVKIYGGVVRAFGGKNAAGIGGGNEGPGVNVEVYGGEVYAWGGDDGAGIGGGWNGSGEQLIVHGGLVKAWGGGNGAGIGSGSEASHVRSGEQIYGGGVTIYGGEVYAYGGVDAAGIGGGEDADGGTVNISGGYVYAKGSYGGAGIGGGEGGDGGNVTITGGTVHASAGSGDTGNRAIGPGYGDDVYGSLTIGDEMMVYSERKAAAVERKNMCWYRTDAHVEQCTHPDHTYTVSGTGLDDTHTEQCTYCTTAFEPELHTFVNNVCTVCGVTETTETHTVSYYLPGNTVNTEYGEPTVYQYIKGETITLPTASDDIAPANLTFAGWHVGTPAPQESIVKQPGESLLTAGTEYTVDSDVSFAARYDYINITLDDDKHNGEVLAHYNGKQAKTVTLKDRTLYRDGRWNTLCLPFNVNAFEGSPLQGATVKTLESTSLDNGTLTLNFSDNVTSIEAGKPYIVKWETLQENITDPVYSLVTINTALAPVETTAAEGVTITFAGAYSPMFIGMERKNMLYLGADNTLYYPNAAMTIGSCRSHFRQQGIEAGDPADPASGVREFVLNFDDGDPTGIEEVSGSRFQVSGWYDLNGRKLNGKP